MAGTSEFRRFTIGVKKEKGAKWKKAKRCYGKF
jgi:hypothetical protein